MTQPSSDLLHQRLEDVFGFQQFRSGQQQIIERLINGQDTLAIMPTGAGKSLCYQLSALMREGLTIIVSPLIALMSDQVAGLKASGVAAEFINSSLSREEKVSIWQQVQSGVVRLLYMSPEQLTAPRMLHALSNLPVGMVVVDEAHCVSQWGHDFRPEYHQLSRLKELFPAATLGAFTATADVKTRAEIEGLLLREGAETFVQGFDRPNIHLAVSYKEKARPQMLAFLEKYRGQQGIIYCLSKKSTDSTAAFLAKEGYNALPYHAGLTPSVRMANQEKFLAEPDVIIVATIAFGMGIDKPDVRFVLHMDLSSTMEAYYQEIGRAGRDGNAAEAMMLFGMDNIKTRRAMIASSPSSEDKKRTEYARLNKLLAYSEAATCRRRVLLEYFGDPAPDQCGNCDMCLSPPRVYDGRDLALAIFDLVHGGQGYVARTYLVSLLLGETSDKAVQWGHDRLAGFGAGKSLSKSDLNRVVLQLVAGGYLEMHMDYGTLALTHKAEDTEAENAPIMLRHIPESDQKSTSRKGAKSRSSGRSSRQAAQSAPALSEDDQALLLTLKRLRMELAEEAEVPAYVIFSDKSLIDMVTQKPTCESEMLAVHGVGQVKFDRHGEHFLTALKNPLPQV